MSSRLPQLHVAVLVLLAVSCATGPIDLADRAVQSGNYLDAIAQYEAAAAADPADDRLQRRIGYAYLKAGDYTEAIRVLSERVAAHPNDGRAILYLGAAYEANEQVDEAIELFAEYNGSEHREQIRQRRSELMWQANNRWAQDRRQFENDLPTPESNTVGVLALEVDDPAGELDGIGDALSGQFVSDLAKIRSLRLVERLRLNAILNELELAKSGAVREGAPRVGRLVGARRLLSGNLALEPGDSEALRIDMGLLDVALGDVKVVSGAGNMESLFEFESDMVFKVLDAMDIEPTPRERAEIQEVPTRSMAAFLAYGRGLEAERKGFPEDARKAFEEAKRLDPNFALPAVALATLSQTHSPMPVDGFIADLPTELSSSDVDPDFLSDVLEDVLDQEGPDPDRLDDIRTPPAQIRIGDPPDPPSSQN